MDFFRLSYFLLFSPMNDNRLVGRSVDRSIDRSSNGSALVRAAFEDSQFFELTTAKGTPLSDLQHCPKHSHTKPNTLGFCRYDYFLFFFFSFNSITVYLNLHSFAVRFVVLLLTRTLSHSLPVSWSYALALVHSLPLFRFISVTLQRFFHSPLSNKNDVRETQFDLFFLFFHIKVPCIK